eukprot:7160619-Alexandrium_andersonii.AAC.1
MRVRCSGVVLTARGGSCQFRASCSAALRGILCRFPNVQECVLVFMRCALRYMCMGPWACGCLGK